MQGGARRAIGSERAGALPGPADTRRLASVQTRRSSCANASSSRTQALTRAIAQRRGASRFAQAERTNVRHVAGRNWHTRTPNVLFRSAWRVPPRTRGRCRPTESRLCAHRPDRRAWHAGCKDPGIPKHHSALCRSPPSDRGQPLPKAPPRAQRGTPPRPAPTCAATGRCPPRTVRVCCAPLEARKFCLAERAVTLACFRTLSLPHASPCTSRLSRSSATSSTPAASRSPLPRTSSRSRPSAQHPDAGDALRTAWSSAPSAVSAPPGGRDLRDLEGHRQQVPGPRRAPAGVLEHRRRHGPRRDGALGRLYEFSDELKRYVKAYPNVNVRLEVQEVEPDLRGRAERHARRRVIAYPTRRPQIKLILPRGPSRPHLQPRAPVREAEERLDQEARRAELRRLREGHPDAQGDRARCRSTRSACSTSPRSTTSRSSRRSSRSAPASRSRRSRGPS